MLQTSIILWHKSQTCASGVNVLANALAPICPVFSTQLNLCRICKGFQYM